MTLYRHFDSKDLLVAECLRRLAAETDAAWEENAGAHAGDPRDSSRLGARSRHVEARSGGARLRLFQTLPQSSRIRTIRRDGWSRNSRAVSREFIALCREAELSNPSSSRTDLLLCEGARVSMQSVGARPSQTAPKSAAPDRNHTKQRR